MFKPDLPISSKSDDLLGRSGFATAFGKALLQYRDQESIVTALYGDWGTGKSSILNMARESMRGEITGIEKNDRPLIVDFNPWNYADQNQLLTQFFKVLSGALKRQDYGQQAEEIGEKLEAYSDFFTPLAMLPDPSGLGIGAAIASRIATKSVGTAAKKWGTAYTKDLQATRAELNKLLKKQNRKIIIVIDDLDRLTSVEIRQIFQLVKMIGDFPNTIYVLAFDKRVVLGALEDVQSGSGEEYLEKIVQFPVEVPPIGRQEIEKLLFAQLDEIVADIPEDRWDQVYWGNVFQEGLRFFFKNLRDVNRYINTLKFSFELVRGEVYAIDFVASTAIEVFEPEIFLGVRNNKDLFTGLLSGTRLSTESDRQQLISRVDEIISRGTEISPEQMKDLLSRLFPKIQSAYENIGYGMEIMAEWRRLGRICHEDNFDTFFRLAIPAGDFSKSELEAIVGFSRDRNAFEQAVRGINESGRIARFLELLLDYVDEVPPEGRENISGVLIDLGDTFPEGEHGFFDVDTSMKVMRVVYQLAKRLDTQDEKFLIYKAGIESASESLWTIVRAVGLLGQEHGRATSNEQLDPEDKRSVSEEQLDDLEKMVGSQIERWAESGRLLAHKQLASILYSWRRMADVNSSVDAFVSDMTATDEGLIAFIAAFVSEGRTYSGGDSVSTARWSIDPNSVADFLELKQTTQRLRDIRESADFERLSAEHQRAIELFLDTLDGKIDRL